MLGFMVDPDLLRKAVEVVVAADAVSVTLVVTDTFFRLVTGSGILPLAWGCCKSQSWSCLVVQSLQLVLLLLAL